MIDLLQEKRLTVAAIALAALLAGCGESNTYVAPPPPKVAVATPVDQKVTRYFEVTGNTSAINSANLVARVSGFLTEISYRTASRQRRGTTSSPSSRSPISSSCSRRRRREAGAEATLTQAQADFDRQTELVARQSASKAPLDSATANRDAAKAKVLQAQADTQPAQINLDYTRVVAPFDGIVTARQVSIGELVGGSGTQVLATIVQLNPIYVDFNASERDVLKVRDMLANVARRRRSARQ